MVYATINFSRIWIPAKTTQNISDHYLDFHLVYCANMHCSRFSDAVNSKYSGK